MAFFYIGNDNEKDVRRCQESRDHQDSITGTGLAVDGQIKDFTGVVIGRSPPGASRREGVARDHSGIKPPTLRPKAGSGSPAR
jgi:hypothetical protein